MDLSYILSKKTSEQWSLNGDEYDGLFFLTGEKPSLAQIELWWEEIKEEDKKNEYKRLREKEYPSEKELIVAMWEMTMEGNSEAANELQKKRTEIKERYPKT